MGACDFTEMELDAIGEIMNISLGASATAVSKMLGETVNITTPTVRVLMRDEFDFKKLEPAVGVEIAYVEGLTGNNVMMFALNDVRIIVGMLMGAEIPAEEFELDEINMSAICEVMNQMMGSSATALSEFFGYAVNISTPVSFPVESEEWFKERFFPRGEKMVVVHFLLEIEGKLKNEFLNIMSTDLVKHLIEPFTESLKENESQIAAEPEDNSGAIQEPDSAEETKELSAKRQEQPVQEPQPMAQPQPSAQPVLQPQPAVSPSAFTVTPGYQSMPVDSGMLQLINQMQQSQMQMLELMKDMKEKGSRESTLIHPAQNKPLEAGALNGEEETVNQEMLMKVPLEISVEIGRTKKLVKDILELTQGSLVVLDKMAGEQADLYVNGQCVARGDIVVVEDNFGIRITEIIARNLNPEIL
ncbi:MAG: flagellar motor switch phosphatase FliY [Enterocloster clostridioformis]|nr:flagellar motor switch phosphatase FliY [Enterocloster clostridioformis]